MTMIDMTIPANRSFVVFTTLASSLAFEVNTGMKMSRIPLLPVCVREGYTGPKSKKKALAWVIEVIKMNVEGWEPSESMLKALGK